ncbi:MBL fold metallo-hydrolase [Aspergillus saccharolyticus JOP 1030-1]|uniref:Metallo-beta-lactamase domain-containing protein n=1 Tax=Aspergillus saccharolyticus JOP 1030-1 TaxID=1450539 RepID=A0A319AK84_9EURO|nr:hypothetical protein BP01DRAFT_390175 [Aspergillus saccharolyticus JOP 1030-1]PYH47032.1 hypothetical protein BP01DRAFT_390175 [Aspergillus saccharolyticus JOP 1030-1]
MTSLKLPQFKGSTVEVSILHAGQTTVPTAYVFETPIPGHDLLDIPCYSFLIENKKKSQRVLFDLGIRKDWREKLPPTILDQIKSAKAVVEIEHDVADQLRKANIPLHSINSIIWSHHHMDHTGDPSIFPPSTELLVGPGFQLDKATTPGYPDNMDAVVTNDAFIGRNLVEVDFSGAIDLGGFPAVDFFQDGSLYLLRSNGHTHNHISALARTSENHFILLAGDVAHHPGEYRPSDHLPLPTEITPSPLDRATHTVPACPSSIFEAISPARLKSKNVKSTPFYELNAAMNEDLENAKVSLERMIPFDGSENVFVIIAHDASLLDVLPFFPESLTDWEVKGYKVAGTWQFLKDFNAAIGQFA